MATNINKLSARKVSSINHPCTISDGNNLYLQVKSYTNKEGGTSIRKNWVLRYRNPINKRDIKFGLGSINTLSLAKARLKARDALELIHEGKDPRQIAEVKRARLAITFRWASDKYITEILTPQTEDPKAEKDLRAKLETYVFPLIGDVPVADITTEHIVMVLKPLWKKKKDGGKLSTAKKIKGKLSQIFKWCKGGQYVQNNPVKDDEIKDSLPVIPNESESHEAISWEEAPQFYSQLTAKQNPSRLLTEFILSYRSLLL